MSRHRLFIAFLRVSRALGLFRLGRAHLRGRLMILCYHGWGFGDEVDWWQGVFIDGRLFERRLQTLRRYGYQVVPLGAGVDALYEGGLDRPTAVLTVDDGFHSTLSIAGPLLRRFELPTTIYVTTYYAEKEMPIYRVVVQYMFWRTSIRTVDLGGLPGCPAGTVTMGDEEDRHRYAWSLVEAGEKLDADEQLRIMRRLGELLDVDYDELERSRIFTLMTLEEVEELAREPWADIQVHTHRHRFPADDLETCRREIADNRAVLSSLPAVGELDHFCYPSGIWDPRVFPALEQSGMRSATTCDHGFNDPQQHRYALRRFLDGGHITELEFEAELSGFSEVVRSFYHRVRGWFRR